MDACPVREATSHEKRSGHEGSIADENDRPRSDTASSAFRNARATRKPEEDLIARGLKFISNAAPETLGSIGVGLAAATYVVLGKLGLILIGAFGGVVLFVSYEARHPEISQIVRSERGTDVLRRLGLDKAPEPKQQNPEEEEERLINSFDDLKPETREALVGLVDAVIRDYIKWWYSPILPSDSSFPLACRKTLNSFLLNVSNALSRKRPADSFLDFLTNTSSIVIVFLSELSAAYADVPAESNISAPDAVYNYLADNADSSLANLLSQSQQAAKFRMVAEDMLQFLDRSAHNCDPARAFLREILAGVVLESSLQACSKPEWINGWIVHLLEAGEPDFSQAIDVGMQTGPDANVASTSNNSTAGSGNNNSNNMNAFVDIDGNVGNIALSKASRNSFEQDPRRRKDQPVAHKKKLSKADEEMEEAMEEMKRMNAMLSQRDDRDSRGTPTATDISDTLTRATHRESTEETRKTTSTSGDASPRSQASFERPAADGSAKNESLHSPITPRSTMDLSSQNSSPKHARNSSTNNFTSFEQIVSPTKEEAEKPGDGPRKPSMLTLHNATITLLDDTSNDNMAIKAKPIWDYLVQIEPASSHHAGWMIVRRYHDFETLHEILRRIAQISGATAFIEQHASLPNWKLHTRESLRGELERYLRDACWYQPLAESVGMKRFLDKDTGLSRSRDKVGLGWETVGKNMADVLSMGSKGAIDGGKAVFGGVTGVFNNMGLGPRRQTNSSLSETQPQAANRLSISTPPRVDSTTSLSGPSVSPGAGGARKPRDSLDSQRSSVVSVQPAKMAPMERRPSYDSRGESEIDSLKPRMDRWDRTSPSGLGSRDHSRASSLAAMRSPLRSPSTLSLDGLKFPTPVEEARPSSTDAVDSGEAQSRATEDGRPREPSSARATSPNTQNATHSQAKRGSVASVGGGTSAKTIRQYHPFSEQETRVAVELIFAIINEMYTLSSAWNIRRTLLTAAKSFLLRPGNPSLVSIQKMMQESVIEGNTSDSGLAHHLRKLRENSMPTDEERAAWPEEMTAEEKEKLRVKARRMLIERGVPVALTGVMGQAATTDALGRIFDCLQIEEVARGLMFGVILQAVRVVTH